jgi:hypothetical protein
MKLGKSLLCILCNSGEYLQKLLYTVKRIRMSPTPTLNIYLFEGAIFVLKMYKNKKYRVQNDEIQYVLIPEKGFSKPPYEIVLIHPSPNVPK